MNTFAPSRAIPEGLKKVPPFPPVATKLLSVLSSADVNVARVADLISSDPMLTARLLQYVNSAVLGLKNPVSNILQAVTLVGLDRTRQLTVTGAAASYAGRGPQNAELQSCWQHSLATAVLADEIANSCGAFTKVVFTAGILHDIGRLGLMVAYPLQYSKAIRDANGLYLDLLDFEREQFGVDHAEAGRLLAEKWDLPEDLRIVAGRHHDPCEGDELSLLWIVHVACNLANAVGFAVIPPRSECDIRALLDTLPGGAGKCMTSTADELHTLVEQRISKFI